MGFHRGITKPPHGMLGGAWDPRGESQSLPWAPLKFAIDRFWNLPFLCWYKSVLNAGIPFTSPSSLHCFQRFSGTFCLMMEPTEIQVCNGVTLVNFLQQFIKWAPLPSLITLPSQLADIMFRPNWELVKSEFSDQGARDYILGNLK